MKNNIVSIKLNEDKVSQFIDFYKENQKENKGEYIAFFAQIDDVTITLYHSKKGYKATFVGSDALNEAKIWDANAELVATKKTIKEEWLCLDNQIGSDEVGVGDFLLPMIVVAAYITKEDVKHLKSLGIHDSKKMKDETILEIGEELLSKYHVSKMILSNKKYNEMIDKGENLNSLKARLHNQALKNLKVKFPSTKNIFVDQFAKESTYYRYLLNKDEPLKGITFKTKGESFYPSIALASVVARYVFLIKKQALEKQYEMEIPFGASKKVDEFAKEFIKKHGLEEFNKIAKKNFANYSKVFE